MRFSKFIEQILYDMSYIYNNKISENIEMHKAVFYTKYSSIINNLNLIEKFKVITEKRDLFNMLRNVAIQEMTNKIKHEIKFDIKLLQEDIKVTELRNKYKLELLNITTTIEQIKSLK